jgi:hypothetical protein
MSNDMSTKNSTTCGSVENKWDSAIFATERRIMDAKEKLAGLRAALRVFKASKERREPWPGEKALLGQDSDL